MGWRCCAKTEPGTHEQMSAPWKFPWEARALGTGPPTQCVGRGEGWARGRFVRGIPQFHIARLSVLPVGFFSATGWRNLFPLFPLSFLHGKTSHQGHCGLMLTEAWELSSKNRQGLSVAPRCVSGGVQHLVFRGDSRNLVRKVVTSYHSPETNFFGSVVSKTHYDLLRDHRSQGQGNKLQSDKI